MLDAPATTTVLPPRPRSPLGVRSALGLLAILLGVTVVGFGSVFLLLWRSPGARAHGATLLAWTLVVVSVAVLAAIHLGLRRAGTSWQGLGFTRPSARILHLLWQVPALLAVLVTVQLTAFLVFQTEPVSPGGVESLLGRVAPVSAVALFVGVTLLVPVWEEAVFRGIIHGGLRRRLGPAVSALLSGGAFAIAHGVPILLPYMLTLGVALALLYEFHRTLWAPTIVHVLLNTAVAGPLLLAALA